ncbi:MAG TPA: LacI family DNA-binding transcriptional regulator [Candidatus Dormibacteraeota bacterium]|jgi:DNA-binding LacI/PurR family transcriptional regulator
MVKIADVAAHAGVAMSTVSYVLSGKRPISEQTRKRVLSSIRALGYHPHAGARALASNRSNVIALVIPLRTGVHVPVVMQFVVSVVTSARKYDHDVLLVTQDEGERGLRRVAGGAIADGLLVMDVELHDVRIPVLRSLSRPSVLIGFPVDAAGLTCIDLDFAAAGALCVDHLADLGHRCVGLVGSPPAVYERRTGFAQRLLAGVEEAAARRGVMTTMHPCEPTPEAALATVERLLRERPDLTGIVVHNEPALQPVLDALRTVGRRVPEDVSVVAVCPDELAQHATPAVSSVTIPAEEVGRQAVDLLMAKLEEEHVPEATLLTPRLTRRVSTAAARGPSPLAGEEAEGRRGGRSERR